MSSFANTQVIVFDIEPHVYLFFQLMETSGTDILNESDVRAPVSPLHLAVSNVYYL